MAQSEISLIAGLGNPGSQYIQTRHNVGFWFLDQLQQNYHFELKAHKKFFGLVGQFIFEGRGIQVLAPTTFMNLSGQSVAALASFYRITPEQILVIHDELDLQPGTIRLKRGGGHGGHNGLRDIIPKLGSADFSRLRIGIGHPGHAKAVSGYVLGAPSIDDRIEIDRKIEQAVSLMPDILRGRTQSVMNKLHSQSN